MGVREEGEGIREYKWWLQNCPGDVKGSTGKKSIGSDDSARCHIGARFIGVIT